MVGKWRQERNTYRCSCCGTGFNIAHGVRNPATFKYCPECGNRMIDSNAKFSKWIDREKDWDTDARNIWHNYECSNCGAITRNASDYCRKCESFNTDIIQPEPQKKPEEEKRAEWQKTNMMYGNKFIYFCSHCGSQTVEPKEVCDSCGYEMVEVIDLWEEEK